MLLGIKNYSLPRMGPIMKDYVKEIVNKELSIQENINLVREYLQIYLLYIFYKKKFYKNLIFTGGTALRILYKVRRFSEDLDFSLSSKAKDYDFEKMLNVLKREFLLSGYDIEIKYKSSGVVHSAFFKFPGLVYDYGLSRHSTETLSIKLEIDTNPPVGGIDEVTLINSIFMFYVMHYDLSSLFAGKLHALLCRKYTKGRDCYDLLWFLKNFKTTEPNFKMLNNALAQTEVNPPNIGGHNWREELRKRIERIDMQKARREVRPFLEEPSEGNFLTKKNLLQLL